MLTEEEKKIIQEEEYRLAIRKEIESKIKPWYIKIWFFFNSSLIIFLLSAVVLASFSSYQQRKAQKLQEDNKKENDKTELVREITGRMKKIHDLLPSSSTNSYATILPYRDSIGIGMYNVITGELNGDSPHAPKFHEEDLSVLLDDLQRLAPKQNVDLVLKHINEFEEFLYKIPGDNQKNTDIGHLTLSNPDKFKQFVSYLETDIGIIKLVKIN